MAIEFGIKANMPKEAMIKGFTAMLESSIASVAQPVKHRVSTQKVPGSNPTLVENATENKEILVEPLPKRLKINNKTVPKSIGNRLDLLIHPFIVNPGLQHIGEKIFLYLDRKSFLNCIIVCKSWKNFLENPRISIKYAQKILSKEQKYLWNFWINTTKDNNACKLIVEELLRKMLKNPVLKNPIFMVMNSDCYKHQSSGLFKNIYPQTRLKCPLCDIEFDDLRNEYKVNSLKKHIVDHLSGNLMINKEKVVFNPELKFMKWIIPKLEYYNKFSYDDHTGQN